MKTKQDLLTYAMGKTQIALTGFLYNYNLVDDKVTILFAAVAGDGTQPNSCIRWQGVNPAERVPSQQEIDKALNEYIDQHGRQNFHIGMVYNPNDFMRKNHNL